MDTEIWKEHPLHSGYLVSNKGRVIGRRGKVLKHAINHRSGYHYTGVYTGGRNCSYTIHRLVLETFVGLRPVGLEASHLDGDKANNALSNLRWETRKQNMDRQYAHGTRVPAPTPTRKLTFDQAREVRSRVLAGELGTALACEFMVSPHVVSRIKLGKAYRGAYTSK